MVSARRIWRHRHGHCLHLYVRIHVHHRQLRIHCRVSIDICSLGSLPRGWWNVGTTLSRAAQCTNVNRTVVGIPMYKNLGTHITLTVLGAISAVTVPIPYLLYFFGGNLRKRSKYAASR